MGLYDVVAEEEQALPAELPAFSGHKDGWSVDGVASVTASAAGVELIYESGERVLVRATVPVPGVLRLSRGWVDNGIPLAEFESVQCQVRTARGGVTLSGPGIEAQWSAREGVRFGDFRQGGGATSMRSALPPAARLLRDGAHAGWIETLGLTPEARVYGGGESFQGPQLAGRVRRGVNRETHGQFGQDISYLAIPFYWSTDGWGVFVRNSGRVDADLGASNTDVASFAVAGDDLDLFCFSGTPQSILADYFAVTGVPEAIPDWAFGVWMSRCSYISAAEMTSVVDELQSEGCPVDVIHIDAWQQGDVITDLACSWEIDRRRFPHGWTAELAARRVRTSMWVNPYITEGSPLAAELADRGLFVVGDDGGFARTPDQPDRLILDFTNPATVQWWTERIGELVVEGASAIKTDFAEEIPATASFYDGRTGAQLRNEYSLLYQRATWAALSTAGLDPVLFARSGTAGAQRTPVHWVGDTPSSWAGLTSALRACLSLSLSGVPLVGHDIGGFWTTKGINSVGEIFEQIDSYDGSLPTAMVADVDEELFVRWAQWAAFSPVMRFHGAGRREPTAYAGQARAAAIAACIAREAIMPYLIEAARDAPHLPLMRPPVLTDPREGSELQYLLGADILVAPILAAGGSRTFWVPPGRWESLMGLSPVEGPGWVTVSCTLHQFPVYRREGSS